MPYSSVIAVTGEGSYKLCKACNLFFPLTGFHLDNGAPDGFRHSCKECCNASSRRHKARDPEKHRQYARDYRLANPDWVKGQMAAYQQRPNGKFAKLKCEAKSRGIQVHFGLKEYADKFYQKPCCYCGAASSPYGHGVDRKDSSGDYTLDNCTPCCGECNVIKNDLITYEEMLAVAKLLKEMRNL